jgi:hypothetical protein
MMWRRANSSKRRILFSFAEKANIERLIFR